VKTRWLLLAMAVVWSVSQAPLLLAAVPTTLVMSRILLGASEGPAYPVAIHSLYKWFPDAERTLPTALLTIGAAFGAGFIAPVITAIILYFGWRAAFLALAVVGLVWSAIWLAIGREGPLESAGDRAPGAQVAEAASLEEKIPLRVLLLSRTCLGCNLSGFAAYVVLALSTIWLPSYLVRVAGYSLMQVGWIVVLPAFGQMVMAPLLGWWSQRLMKRGVASRHARGTLGCGGRRGVGWRTSSDAGIAAWCGADRRRDGRFLARFVCVHDGCRVGGRGGARPSARGRARHQYLRDHPGGTHYAGCHGPDHRHGPATRVTGYSPGHRTGRRVRRGRGRRVGVSGRPGRRPAALCVSGVDLRADRRDPDHFCTEHS
jgi:Sugar phosphate permease